MVRAFITLLISKEGLGEVSPIYVSHQFSLIKLMIITIFRIVLSYISCQYHDAVHFLPKWCHFVFLLHLVYVCPICHFPFVCGMLVKNG